jgi:hypothetical protein
MRSGHTLVAVVVALGLALPTVAEAQRTAPAGSSSAGTATSRSGPSGGGSSGGGSSGPASVGSSGGGGGSSSAGNTVSGSGGPTGRDRNGRPIVGAAGSRATVNGLPGPLFGPWGRFVPFYGTGFNYGFGFVQYDPFLNSSYGLLWGPWYDPYFYDPFNPFGYGYTGFRYGGYYSPGMAGAPMDEPAMTTHVTGSIRLKVSPDTAKVYVDGVLAGVVSEFDGLLSHHLTLEAGSHQLELRAEGFQTYQETVAVDAGKTLTERISLKKAK